MFPLTEAELQKLKALAYDETAVEGLKKLFMKSFLSDDILHEVEVLAASRLSIKFLEAAFNELGRMAEKEPEQKKRQNIV